MVVAGDDPGAMDAHGERGMTLERWRMPGAPLAQLVFGMMAAKSVAAAIEVGVVDLLADGARTDGQLVQAAGVHGPSVRRLLRTLIGAGIVASPAPGQFELTDLGRLLLPGVPGSMRAFVQTRCAAEFWQSWGSLPASIRTGTTAWELAHGVPWLEYYASRPDQWATFNRHMSQHTRDAAPAIVAAGDFARFQSIVDVGGGDGTLIAEILKAYPALRGVVFDLPGVGSDRADFVAGDFFESVPAGADAYLMKFILHDWDDDRAVAILTNCRAAMAPGGRVLIVERVLPEKVSEADLLDLLSDMLMLVATGGVERAEAEYRALLAAADLTLVSVSEPLPPFGYRLIEAAAGTQITGGATT